MPDLSPTQWMLAVFAALGMGVSKAGFAGVGLFHVVVFALLFGARDSTGVVLPMLLVGDVGAVVAFRRQARWDHLRRMLPPACLGIVVGAVLMGRISDAMYKPLIGWIILALTTMQVVRTIWPDAFGDVPHGRPFAWTIGLLAGGTTMLANAASPIMSVYFLAVALPKLEFVGTTAWFFLIINAFKVPFSAWLGLIHTSTLLFNVVLSPVILAGLWAGGWLTRRVPQRLFDGLLLAFAGIAALRLIGVF
jgi:uncharacterized membrane protein YfcA